MGQTVTNAYVEGMNKDIDRGLISNKAYLEANNFRIITTDGSTTGSLENIRGNKHIIPLIAAGEAIVPGTSYYVVVDNIVDDGGAPPGFLRLVNTTFTAVNASFTGDGYVIPSASMIDDDQMIIGGIEIRDEVVLFTTDNTGTTPTEGRSCIWKMSIDLDTEEISSLTLLYDDNLNAGLVATDFLKFSTAYPIKAVARYETSTIKKIYWTDGYNYLRHVDIGRLLTISGEAYSVTNRYMTVDKFNVQPNFKFTKPTLSNIITGTLEAGTVQYAYQLFRTNGSETTYSPLSNTIHITESNDFSSNDQFYKGSDGTEGSTGKGCRVKIFILG